MDDNARKFLLSRIDADFWKTNNASWCVMMTDWIITEEASEKKLVYKKFENDEVQFLLITKVTIDGKRTTDKKKITEQEYKELLGSAIVHVEKKRYEFEFVQNNIPFGVKYDEFSNSLLNVLEVDAQNEEERNLFDPNQFPCELQEVTGDLRYYGYRVAQMV